jgi:hypothetical protein
MPDATPLLARLFADTPPLRLSRQPSPPFLRFHYAPVTILPPSSASFAIIFDIFAFDDFR